MTALSEELGEHFAEGQPIELGGGQYLPAQQIWRTPFVCGFETGWPLLILAMVHIAYEHRLLRSGRRPPSLSTAC